MLQKPDWERLTKSEKSTCFTSWNIWLHMVAILNRLRLHQHNEHTWTLHRKKIANLVIYDLQNFSKVLSYKAKRRGIMNIVWLLDDRRELKLLSDRKLPSRAKGDKLLNRQCVHNYSIIPKDISVFIQCLLHCIFNSVALVDWKRSLLVHLKNFVIDALLGQEIFSRQNQNYYIILTRVLEIQLTSEG